MSCRTTEEVVDEVRIIASSHRRDQRDETFEAHLPRLIEMIRTNIHDRRYGEICVACQAALDILASHDLL